jgi:hydrogenase maturation protease
LSTVLVDGVEVRKGSRVRLRPGAGADVLDLAVAGRIAVVEDILKDADDRVHVAVRIEDDPGADFADARYPGHRFFFAPAELEPLVGADARPTRILVAGIGNVFFGDDGFGVEVARRLLLRPRRPGVEVADFGIRGVDLAYALGDGYHAAVIIDAAPRGGAPGLIYVIEPRDQEMAGTAPDAHGMDPARVLSLARRLGACPSRVLIVGCEPASVPTDLPDDEIAASLSPVVERAVDTAVTVVEDLVSELIQSEGVVE